MDLITAGIIASTVTSCAAAITGYRIGSKDLKNLCFTNYKAGLDDGHERAFADHQELSDAEHQDLYGDHSNGHTDPTDEELADWDEHRANIEAWWPTARNH